MSTKKSRVKAEYGDFQTPLELVQRICSSPYVQNLTPKSIVEPTCGYGNFLIGALQNFDSLEHLLGVEVNPIYARRAQDAVHDLLRHRQGLNSIVLIEDFFEVDWVERISELPEPILFIGNPPWVTNTELMSLNSNNIPSKTNFQRWPGIEAITGASNFDISEWMLLQMIQCLEQKNGAVAMLCKTSVARKILLAIWKTWKNQLK